MNAIKIIVNTVLLVFRRIFRNKICVNFIIPVIFADTHVFEPL